MGCAEVIELVDSSALEALETKSAHGISITEQDVRDSILSDLASLKGLSQVLMTKFLRQGRVSERTLKELGRSLQNTMAPMLESDPEMFLKYSQAQLIVANELKRKATKLALVVGV
jgi:hypothetical protein